MANWTDGPEYAPTERPAAFETPAVAPLEVPPAVTNLADGAPLDQPTWQSPQAVAPLSSLVPADAVPARDPLSEFVTVSSTMTSDAGAWGSAHAATDTLARPTWTPDQPLTTSGVSGNIGAPGAPGTATWPAPLDPAAPAAPTAASSAPTRGLNFPPPHQAAPSFPQPGTPDWFAPAPQNQWRPPDQSVTLADMWREATPGVLIALIVGAMWAPLSVIMLGVAALLAGRIRYRLAQVRRAFNWSFILLAVIGALSLYNSDLDLDAAWSVLSGWAQVLCWVVGIATMLLVGAGIRAHEPPNRP